MPSSEGKDKKEPTKGLTIADARTPALGCPQTGILLDSIRKSCISNATFFFKIILEVFSRISLYRV